MPPGFDSLALEQHAAGAAFAPWGCGFDPRGVL